MTTSCRSDRTSLPNPTPSRVRSIHERGAGPQRRPQGPLESPQRRPVRRPGSADRRRGDGPSPQSRGYRRGDRRRFRPLGPGRRRLHPPALPPPTKRRRPRQGRAPTAPPRTPRQRTLVTDLDALPVAGRQAECHGLGPSTLRPLRPPPECAGARHRASSERRCRPVGETAAGCRQPAHDRSLSHRRRTWNRSTPVESRDPALAAAGIPARYTRQVYRAGLAREGLSVYLPAGAQNDSGGGVTRSFGERPR
jgi:hypothetical protein